MNITPFDTLEESHQDDTLKWINSNAEIYRTEKPSTPPKHLVSYSIVLDIEKQKILLTAHRKSRLWLPPGGHVEMEEHPEEAAKRELEEELGKSFTLLQVEPLFLTVTQTVGHTPNHTDVSLWYIFSGNSLDSYQYDTREFSEIKWFSFTDLPIEQTDPHLLRFRNKFEHFYFIQPTKNQVLTSKEN